MITGESKDSQARPECDMEVDGIITNRPDRAKQIVSRI